MRTRAFTTVGWEKYLVPTNPFVQNFLNKNGDDVLWQVALNIHNAILDAKENVGFVVHVNAPSVVISTGFFFLSNTIIPTSSSNLEIMVLRVDCVMQHLSAAFSK